MYIFVLFVLILILRTLDQCKFCTWTSALSKHMKIPTTEVQTASSKFDIIISVTETEPKFLKHSVTGELKVCQQVRIPPHLLETHDPLVVWSAHDTHWTDVQILHLKNSVEMSV